MSDPIDQLTEPQRECLRLVLSHHNSKEIASLLGVSPSAVDKRIERAVQMLGASSRFSAARMLADSEGSAYDRITCEPIDVPEPVRTEAEIDLGGPFGVAQRLVGMSPDKPFGGVRNALGRRQRLAVIMGLILFVSVTTMALLNLASTLSEFVETHRSRSGD